MTRIIQTLLLIFLTGIAGCAGYRNTEEDVAPNPDALQTGDLDEATYIRNTLPPSLGIDEKHIQIAAGPTVSTIVIHGIAKTNVPGILARIESFRTNSFRIRSSEPETKIPLKPFKLKLLPEEPDREEIITDNPGILSVRNPPTPVFGRKIATEPGVIGITDDFGNLVRIEMKLIGKAVSQAKIAQDGERALLDYWFDVGYFPTTYGTLQPPSTILSREYIEVDSKPVLLIFLSSLGCSPLEVDEKHLDSRRCFAAYMESTVCVMIAFELNTLDAKTLPLEEEKVMAQNKMIDLIRSITVDQSKVPQE